MNPNQEAAEGRKKERREEGIDQSLSVVQLQSAAEGTAAAAALFLQPQLIYERHSNITDSDSLLTTGKNTKKKPSSCFCFCLIAGQHEGALQLLHHQGLMQQQLTHCSGSRHFGIPETLRVNGGSEGGKKRKIFSVFSVSAKMPQISPL